jgi:hypothetical protein
MTALILTLFGLGTAGLVVVSLLSHREGSRVESRVGAASVSEPRTRGQAIPRMADIAGFVMAYRVGRVPVGRIAVLGFWWWIGWHFFAR